MLNLLTLHSNVNCLYCTPTIIASFTSVFSSFISVNVGKLQYTAVCALTTGGIDPKHSWLRGPRCITSKTCIATFNNKLIFDWLNGYWHCNFKGHSRWLNTVLGVVRSNSRDGSCFKLDKETWRRKSNGTQKTISQNLLIEILWYLAEVLLISYFQ